MYRPTDAAGRPGACGCGVNPHPGNNESRASVKEPEEGTICAFKRLHPPCGFKKIQDLKVKHTLKKPSLALAT